MNLHFVADQKFVVPFIESLVLYDVVSKNIFIKAKGTDGFEKSKYVNEVDLDAFDIDSYVRRNEVKKIYFHGFTEDSVSILKKMKEKLHVSWIFYGADAYGLSVAPNVLEPISLNYKWRKVVQNPDITVYLRQALYLAVRFFLRDLSKMYYMRKVNEFAFWLRSDYEWIKKRSFLNMSFSFFVYSGFTDEFSENTLVKECDRYILGNSGALTNNHFDLIALLGRKMANSEFVIPLSYGCDAQYVDAIRKQCIKENLKCTILDKFIDTESYRQILASTKGGIFYHRRQQAGGNILMLLRNRKNVYLHKESPLLQFYTEIGCKVFNVDDFFVGKELNKDEKDSNAKIVSEFFSEEKTRDIYIKMFS